jgi:hypothetical protein
MPLATRRIASGRLAAPSGAPAGPVVVVSTRRSDRVALFGPAGGKSVYELLDGLRYFDAIFYGSSQEHDETSANTPRYAVIRPRTDGELRPEKQPGRKLRIGRFDLDVVLELPWGPEGETELDRVYGDICNALLAYQNADWGGFCLFEQSDIERDNSTDLATPTASMRLRGVFAYVVESAVAGRGFRG